MLSAVRVIGALAALITVASLAGIAGAEGGAGAAVVMVLAMTAIEGLVAVQLSALSEPLFVAALASTLALMVGSPARPLALPRFRRHLLGPDIRGEEVFDATGPTVVQPGVQA
jgi:hypothetical protein